MVSRRGFIKSGVLFTLFPFNCDDCDRPPTGPENIPPIVGVTKSFDNNENVEYRFSATDSDGSINYIDTWINDNYNSVRNGASLTALIIKGTNIVKATAYDNQGLASSQFVSSFSPLDEDDSKIKIDSLLASNANTFSKLEKDVLVSPRNESFNVDFLIKKKDETDAVINYVGFGKNLDTEKNNKTLLDNYGIPNLYLFRLPENEANSRVNGFINGGYS